MANFKYLIKVEPGANNNKFYKMTEDDDTIAIQYGRVGCENPRTTRYSIHDWNKKLNEKLRKGYEDKTSLMAEVTVSSEHKRIPVLTIRTIVERLQRYANTAIKENYTISSTNVTQAMIDEAKIQMDKLYNCKTLTDFNEELINLYKIIPRKMKKVKDTLATESSEFAKILLTESDLLDVMSNQVTINDLEPEEKSDKTILEVLGIVIEPTTDDDVRKIKKQMGNISNKYFDSWKVTNLKTQAKFDEYAKKHNTKPYLLFHGTKNENVFSISKSGLILRPNASITGKMFGYGIYFAPSAGKSMGYTSLRGSYWSSGSSHSGFMLLFDVATDKPYNVYSFDSKYYDFDYAKLQRAQSGANCLFAHGGTGMLRNDEIIIYKEEQSTVKYLIEIK